MKKLSELSLLEREELFKTLRVNITHHSNAIEGTTLTYGETKQLLENGITAPNKRMDEQLVILGFAQAYDMVIREASNTNKLLDTSFIKDLHYLIFSNAYKITPNFIRKPIGAYRTENVSIAGCNIKLSLPSQIAQNLENLLFRFKSHTMDLNAIAEFHAMYEQIHPFSDGNGRTGRLIMSFQCIQNDLIPPLIENEKRSEYLECLSHVQTQGDLEPFVQFLKYCQNRSLELI
ncbi:Fic family protein [Helicobacter sp. 11S02596-1]|uniref:Fic family protein n=1 Tax=Helicobacter sp. 11S02596-1 TaxID=1476194 RepID=UPI000BA65AAD|nr:Fic family protein [Helicobacter sp. 11S02596-1]PAF44475.1 cell filamentation protein Fic [Helicobacter sp. 11S02596-1]